MDIIIVTSARHLGDSVLQSWHLAKTLTEYGCNVTFFAYQNAAVRQLDISRSVRWKNLPASLWNVNSAILKNINPHEQTVVHAFHSHAVRQFALLGIYWRMKRMPLACVAHRDSLPSSGNSLPCLLPGIQAYIAHAAQYGRQRPPTWHKSRVRIVDDLVPAERLIPERFCFKMREEMGIGPYDIVIGAAAGGNLQKSVDELLKGYNLIRKKLHQPIWLLALGNGNPAWKKYGSKIREAENSFFIQTQLNADYLQVCDLFLFSANAVESQPAVLLEALCMGLPVIAACAGGVADLLDEEYLFDPQDTDGAARMAVSLIGDVTRLQTASLRNLTRSSRFGAESYMRSVFAIYEEVARESARYAAQKETQSAIRSGRRRNDKKHAALALSGNPATPRPRYKLPKRP